MVRLSALATTLAIASCLGACASEDFADSAEEATIKTPLVTSGVTGTLTLTSDWTTGYCAKVTLANSNSTAVSSWTVSINLNGTSVTQIWGGTYSVSNGIMTVKPQGNASIAANSSMYFVYCASAPNATKRPAIASLAIVGSSTSGTGGSSSTGGTAAYQCGLPVAGTTGVAKPSGTAGNLRILNWAGLKGAISFTFDDGSTSQIQHYAELKALGIPLTFYLVTGWTNASNAIWKQAVADGHEIGNHTKTHPQTASLSDITDASTFIQSTFGKRPWTMAAPYGDSSYVSIAQSLFLLNRGVGSGSIAPNDSTNPFNLPVYIPPASASSATMNTEIAAAQSGGKWRVFLVHGFSDVSDGSYQPIAIGDFTATAKYAKGLGNLWLDTMTNVGSYWRAQKILSSVTPTTSGTTKTYSWTLPSNFPSGKCLRVTADGGTLKQNGATLPWNSRGYYEVSLDVGSLAISP